MEPHGSFTEHIYSRDDVDPPVEPLSEHIVMLTC